MQVLCTFEYKNYLIIKGLNKLYASYLENVIIIIDAFMEEVFYE